jgi:arylsulfatase A-like enzyme
MPMQAPNIVLIFSDNHPADMMGCSGNDEIFTPHLDRLAQGAVRFENAFCPNSLCSPCRASVLTGLMPSQHGVHTWLDDGMIAAWPDGWTAIGEFDALAARLSHRGYDTALVGKYHLGLVDQPQNGFRYWVTLQSGLIESFNGNDMIENGRHRRYAGHLVDYFTEMAVDYITQRAAQPKQPFFLYLTYPAPYGLWPSVKGEPDNRHAERYHGMAMQSVPREAVSKELIDWVLVRHDEMPGDYDDYYQELPRHINDLPTLRNYYSQMSMVDDGVGQVLHALERAGVMDNTLVVYTSDHGMSLGQHGFWGHGEDTWPSNTHREAHHIPLIVRPPGREGEGRVESRLVGTTDIFATILDYARADLPARAQSSARSMRPLLENEPVAWQDAVFMDQEETRAIRTDRWLLMRRFAPTDYGFCDELYDLAADPDERNDVIADPAHAEVVAELSDRIDRFFKAYADPKWDLWNGGSVKSNSSRPFLWKQVWGDDWAPQV